MSADWWLEGLPDGEEAEWNLTYNLNRMLFAAGWHWGDDPQPPQTSFPNSTVWPSAILQGMRAGDVHEKLAGVVVALRNDPQGFREFNPPNGWGSYEDCLEQMQSFLAAVERWPDARIGVSF